MNLILSDKDLELNFKNDKKIKYYNLSNLTINNCMGCFHCWVKTPGKCIVRDDAIKTYPLIAKSENIIYVSKIKYGDYENEEKIIFEKLIERNAKNMNFSSYNILFIKEKNVKK